MHSMILLINYLMFHSCVRYGTDRQTPNLQKDSVIFKRVMCNARYLKHQGITSYIL